MSVESRKPDPAILRKFGLSKKEEVLKQKLFQKKGSNAQSVTKTNTIVQQMSPPKSATLKSQNNLKESLNLATMKRENSATDEMIGTFLRTMEKEFSDLNKKQITMGMLQHQTNILKDHTEILNENQKNLANMIKNDHKQRSVKPEEIQKQVMKDIIGPINGQIMEIKKLYENTKNLAENVAKSVNDYKNMSEKNEPSMNNPQALENYQRSIQDAFGNYKSMNSNLKDMVYHAQGSLSQVLPENMQIIQQMSDLNVQAYTSCINTLKKQIEDLQRDAEKAEKELEVRYKKLSQVPKPGTIKTTDPYYPLVANGPETSEDVIKNIRTIDFTTSRQIIMNKLGGEFDYDQFNDEVSELANKIYDVREKALEDIQEFQIDLPSHIELLEYDKNIVNGATTGPSIIDEIKAKYNIPKQMVMPKPTTAPVVSPPFYSQNQLGPPVDYGAENQKSSEPLKPKKKNIRPKELDYIRTVPQQVLPDIKYSKMEPPQRPPVFREESARRAQEVPQKSPAGSEQEEVKVDKKASGLKKKEEVRDYHHHHEEEEYHEEEPQEREPIKPENRGPQTYISMDRYDMKMGSSQDVKQRQGHDLSFDQVRGSDALFNRLFEGLLLQDIKDQIIASEPIETREPESPKFHIQERPLQIQPVQPNNIPGNSQTGGQLFYPQHLGSQIKDLHGDNIDNKLLEQIALEALAEKLLPSLKSELQREEESQAHSIFHPVESKPIPEIRHSENNQASHPGHGANLLNLGMNNAELPTLIAENIMNLFNAAMMQINTSLSKNFGQVTQADLLSQKHKENVGKTISMFSRSEEHKDHHPHSAGSPERRKEEGSKPSFFSKLRKEDEPEQRRDVREEPLPEEKKPLTLFDALSKEQKLIQEEQDILRNKRHFLSPNQGLGNSFGIQPQPGYYFAQHEPQPIANLAEYYKELQSDGISISEEPYSRVMSMRNLPDNFQTEDRRPWGTPSNNDHDMMSEGQVFPQFDQRTEGVGSEIGEIPGFAGTRTIGADSEASIDGRLNSTQKAVITDNLFKNLHEEDREPGEINIFNIFRA